MERQLRRQGKISRCTAVMKLLAIAGILVAPGLSVNVSTFAQTPEDNELPESRREDERKDPISPLNLTPEQRERIRAIREDLKEERAKIGQRLRETNRALQDALDANNPDEAVVEQRLQDLAAAQAAQMRLRVMTELRIRRVLTAEQQAMLHRMRLRAGGPSKERTLMRRLRQGQSGKQRRHSAEQVMDSDKPPVDERRAKP